MLVGRNWTFNNPANVRIACRMCPCKELPRHRELYRLTQLTSLGIQHAKVVDLHTSHHWVAFDLTQPHLTRALVHLEVRAIWDAMERGCVYILRLELVAWSVPESICTMSLLEFHQLTPG